MVFSCPASLKLLLHAMYPKAKKYSGRASIAPDVHEISYIPYKSFFLTALHKNSVNGLLCLI